MVISDLLKSIGDAEFYLNNNLIELRNKPGLEGWGWCLVAELAFIFQFALNVALLPLAFALQLIGVVFVLIGNLGRGAPLEWLGDLLKVPYNVCIHAIAHLGKSIVLNPFVEKMEQVNEKNVELDGDFCGAADSILDFYHEIYDLKRGILDKVIKLRNESSGIAAAGARLLAGLVCLLLFAVHLPLAVAVLPFYILFLPFRETSWGKVLVRPFSECYNHMLGFIALFLGNICMSKVQSSMFYKSTNLVDRMDVR